MTEAAADLSSELTGGNGVFVGEALPANLAAGGYVQHEYVAAGTATSYAVSGELTPDGKWSFAPDTVAPYRTRVLVRAPADPSAFSGTAVVEWLNVSGGVDASPDWTSLHEEIMRAGHVWLGVSAQRIGVMGGPTLVGVQVEGADAAGKGLRAIDPERYGSLDHPGDGYAFDIFTQVARAIRSGDGTNGSMSQRVLAVGESQSAIALVTYYNGVQPLAQTFDGFLVHSRGAFALPLASHEGHADLASSFGGTPTMFRDDLAAPVLNMQTETDVIGVFNSAAARQPDSDRFRLWEVAGTAHADQHLLGPTAASIDCGAPINNGPMHVVAKAALRALDTWVGSGRTPTAAARLEVKPGTPPEVTRDVDGIAVGGVRTPPVDVPVATLSGQPGPNPSIICFLLGSTIPFGKERLAELYPSRETYLQQYETSVDATIKAGFALEEDRAALLDYADPSRIAG